MFDVRHDAHDGEPGRGAVDADANPLADRVAAGPELPGHAFVHDDDGRRPRVVAREDPATPENRSSDGLEVAGRNRAVVDDRNGRSGLGGLPLHVQLLLRIAPAERDPVHQPRLMRSRNRSQRLEQPALEHPDHRVVCVLGPRQLDPRGQHAVGPESGIHLQGAPEASEQQPGSDQQDQRQGELRDHESMAQPSRPAGGAAPGPLTQTVERVQAGRANGRRHAEQHPGCEGDAKRENQDQRVEPDLVEPGYRSDLEALDRANPEHTKQQPGGAAQQGEHQAFGEKLRGEPAGAGAKTAAQGHFPGTGDGSGQQQVSDVGRRDEQHEPYGTQQNQQRRPGLPHQALEHRLHHGSRPRLGVRKTFRPAEEKLVAHGHHVAVGILHREARLEPRHGGEVPVAGIIRFEEQRKPQLGTFGKIEARGHDPDDDGRAVSHLNGLADQTAVTAKAALPEPMAQHGNAVLAGGPLLRQKGPPGHRNLPQHPEEVGGNAGGLHPLRVPVTRQAHAGDGIRRDRFEHPVPLLEREEHRLGIVHHRKPLFRRGAPERHQVFRLGVRQRLEQDAVDRAEDRGVGSDAQGQREHGDRGETGPGPEDPDAKPEVLEEVREPAGPGSDPRRRRSGRCGRENIGESVGQLALGELVQGNPPGLVGAVAPGHQVPGSILQVLGQLLHDLGFLGRVQPERGEPPPELLAPLRHAAPPRYG